MTNLAAVIRGSHADVVVLQEVTTGATKAVEALAAAVGGGSGASWGSTLSGPQATGPRLRRVLCAALEPRARARGASRR